MKAEVRRPAGRESAFEERHIIDAKDLFFEAFPGVRQEVGEGDAVARGPDAAQGHVGLKRSVLFGKAEGEKRRLQGAGHFSERLIIPEADPDDTRRMAGRKSAQAIEPRHKALLVFEYFIEENGDVARLFRKRVAEEFKGQMDVVRLDPLGVAAALSESFLQRGQMRLDADRRVGGDKKPLPAHGLRHSRRRLKAAVVAWLFTEARGPLK